MDFEKIKKYLKFSMLTIRSTNEIQDSIKKSRFIGVVSPSKSKLDIVSLLQELHVRHPNATHIPYAYRLMNDTQVISRFFDDGEPSGTAGKPILQHIEGRNIINAVVMVVRYFGGVKLGAGGLVRAYGNCAKQAIASCELYPHVEYETISVTIPYDRLELLEYQLKKLEGYIESRSYVASVELTISLPREHKGKLLATLSSGNRPL